MVENFKDLTLRVRQQMLLLLIYATVSFGLKMGIEKA